MAGSINLLSIFRFFSKYPLLINPKFTACIKFSGIHNSFFSIEYAGTSRSLIGSFSITFIVFFVSVSTKSKLVYFIMYGNFLNEFRALIFRYI